MKLGSDKVSNKEGESQKSYCMSDQVKAKAGLKCQWHMLFERAICVSVCVLVSWLCESFVLF